MPEDNCDVAIIRFAFYSCTTGIFEEVSIIKDDSQSQHGAAVCFLATSARVARCRQCMEHLGIDTDLCFPQLL